MKLPAARIAAFLQRPDQAIRAVLLYGPDIGLVRERADVLARTVCPDLRDPFRVADLSGAALAADPARLADEAAQMSLIGDSERIPQVRTDGPREVVGAFAYQTDVGAVEQHRANCLIRSLQKRGDPRCGELHGTSARLRAFFGDAALHEQREPSHDLLVEFYNRPNRSIVLGNDG